MVTPKSHLDVATPEPAAARDFAIDLLLSGVDPNTAASILTAPPGSKGSCESLEPEEYCETFYFDTNGAVAAPVIAPIDPVTGSLPAGIELPVTVPDRMPVMDRPPDGEEGDLVDGYSRQAPELPTLKQLGLFCLPTLGIWLSSPLLSLIDTSVVGLTCSTTHLAALAPSTKLCDYVAFFCSVIGAATTNLAADAFAKQDPTRAKRIIGSSLTIATAVGAAVAASIFFAARPLMASMLALPSTAASPVLAAATQYTSIRALGYPAALLTFVLQSAFISTKDSKSPLLAVPLVAAVNLVADILLVPSMGAVGAAWATTLALYANAATLLGMWARKTKQIGGDKMRVMLRPKMREVKALLAFAAPMMVALIARVSMGLSITLSAVALGTTALAANQVIESLYWLFCPFGEAISLCMQAYLPTLLLHGRSLARRLQSSAFRAAACLGLLAAGAGATLPVVMPGLFTTCPTVTAACAQAAPMLGATLFSYVLFCATEGMLIARKQLRFLATAHVVNAISFGLALKVAVTRPAIGLHHIWALFGLMNVARLGVFTVALRLEDRNAVIERATGPRRWRRALRSLSVRIAARRMKRRDSIHDAVPDVSSIAPHLLAEEGVLDL